MSTPSKISMSHWFAGVTALAMVVAVGAAGGAMAQAVTPRLAPDVKQAPAYEAVKERLVVANPTPIFSDTNPASQPTGQLERIGEPVQILAKVPVWDWYLIGKNGVGIGYVPRSLLKPAGS